MKRKSSFFIRNTGAAQFALSFLICALIFTGVALTLVLKVIPSDESTQTAAPVSGVEKGLSSFTMLFSVGTPQNAPAQLILYRLDTKNGRTAIMSLPASLAAPGDGPAASLADVYSDGGITSVKKAVQKLLSINIDYTCDIEPENYIKIFELLGGLYSSVPEDITCAVPGSGSVSLAQSPVQYLSGPKIYALAAADGYLGGITAKCAEQSVLMKEFVEEKLTDFYLSRPNDNFGTIFNLVSTDFAMNDLIKYADTMKTLSQAQNIKVVNPVLSDTTEALYLISNISNVREYFS